MAQQPLMGFLVPSIARRISILSGHAVREKELAQLKIAISSYSHKVTLRGDEDQALWHQDNDPAVEIAVTSKTLQHLMLYHGALVKVRVSVSSTADLLQGSWHTLGQS